jgi:hypothetical protein
MARITSEETIGKWKKFDISVIVFAMLTGAGFGVFAGMIYTGRDFTWDGLMAGTVSSFYLCLGLITGAVSNYFLAKWYLKMRMEISLKGHSKKLAWLLSTLIAALCGVICTSLIHGFLVLATKLPDMQPLDMEGMFPIVIAMCEVIGACAGLILGGISSLVYVSSPKNKSIEAA